MTTLYFHIFADKEKETILKMFFKSWADSICDNQVKYSTVDFRNSTDWLNETIRADFDNEEDALALKLKGVPTEFQGFLTMLG